MALPAAARTLGSEAGASRPAPATPHWNTHPRSPTWKVLKIVLIVAKIELQGQGISTASIGPASDRAGLEVICLAFSLSLELGRAGSDGKKCHIPGG